MFNSKKKKVLRRLGELSRDIEIMQTLSEFHGWLAESLHIADTYIKSKEPYNKLLELNHDAELDASIIHSSILQPNLREKANALIKTCIKIIDSNGISTEKDEITSFNLLEFIRKYSLTGTLVVGIFWLGYNHFKNENEVNIQKARNTNLTNEIVQLKELNIKIASKLDSILRLGQVK